VNPRQDYFTPPFSPVCPCRCSQSDLGSRNCPKPFKKRLLGLVIQEINRLETKRPKVIESTGLRICGSDSPAQDSEDPKVVFSTSPILDQARTNLSRHFRSYLCPRIEPPASENLIPPARSGTLQSRNHLQSGISRTRATTPNEPFAPDSWGFPSFLVVWFLGDHPGSPSRGQYGDESLYI
jgi:hypothetical protein